MILEKSLPSICLIDLIESKADKNPEAIAIAAIGRVPLNYFRLSLHLQDTALALNAMGIGRDDRVALVLPNGAEAAVAFLAIASTAICAPLNPLYRVTEFEFYFADLNAKAVIVQHGIAEAARTAAKALGIPIIELLPSLEAEAGIFRLEGTKSSPTTSCFNEPDDIALLLHTSGTTSRPKIVQLTQKNLCLSAHNICLALHLVESDRCLNIMPLFHIHGLIGCLLSSLSAGASVVCTPRFDPSQFLEWLAEFQPTWYSAVPTMHQAILSSIDSNQKILTSSSLRLIRSSSASLAPQVMTALESTFKVPVIEAYGMTEAAHQITSNPLPPQIRKPSSVGVAVGTTIAIMDEEGNLLPISKIGEVVIQGTSITQGYEHNPEANVKAFTHGWFRTGDQGYLDKDGYLFLKGRLKEIISRGAEKISPLEIDQVLMELPDIIQAVTFAVPHFTLGEDVAAAVVLKKGSQLTSKTIRQFLFERLADFKIPSQVIIIDSIPQGATGKLQRIGLSEKLEAYLKPDFIAPRDELEKAISLIFSEVLGIQKISTNDNFFALGGDSLSGTRVVVRISAYLDIQLPNVILFQKPTVAELAQEVAKLKEMADAEIVEMILAIENLSEEEIQKLLAEA